MGEGGAEHARGFVEELELVGREVVEGWAVAAHEVREDRPRLEGSLVEQAVDEHGDVHLGVETEAVHARVQFQVNREVRHALAVGSLDERLQQSEGIDLGLQVIVEEGAHR